MAAAAFEASIDSNSTIANVVTDAVATVFNRNYALAIIYAFRLSIGDTDTDWYGDAVQGVTLYVLFVLAILFTNIVMLNLLIAIISDSFEKINSNADSANYQERACLIAENGYLIPPYRRVAYCPADNLLILACAIGERSA